MAFFFLFINNSLKGENLEGRLENYQPLQSSGQLPEIFVQTPGEQFQKAKEKITNADERNVRKQKEAFYQQSNYMLNEILENGQVLFNDPVGNYVNRVADNVLAHLPELQEELSFYIIKSTNSNAFATSQGVIFVSLGLIAQLQNEAQLAFILAHEISHYRKNDVIRQFLENRQIEAQNADYEDLNYGRLDLAKKKYSRELEMKADENALEIYKKTPYSKKELPGVMDVLHYSYLPFKDAPFKTDFLSTKHLKFPDKYFLKDIQTIQTDKEDYEVTNSTHPNTQERKEQMRNFMSGLAQIEGKQFIEPEEEFKKARLLARFEQSRLYYFNLNYADAIYNSYLLLKDYPDNQYLREIIAKSLYNLTVYKNEKETHEILESYNEIEGEIQQLYHFLDELKPEELNTTALIYTWHLSKENPDNTDINILAEALIEEFVSEHRSDMKKLSKISRQEAAQRLSASDTSTSNNKYDKIESLKKKSEIKVEPGNIVKYAFVDLLKDTTFVNTFEKYASEKSDDQEDKNLTYQRRKQRNDINKKGKALGIDDIVVVDPFYRKLDRRKEVALRLFPSQESENGFVQQIEELAQEVNLNTTVINPDAFTKNDVEKYNRISYLNNWIGERLAHEGDVLPMIVDDRAIELSNEYGTNYFSWTGTLALTQKENGKAWYFVWGTFVPPLLPYAVYRISTADNFTYYYNLVLDLRTGDPKLVESEDIRQKDRKSIVKSHLYFSLQQISAER